MAVRDMVVGLRDIKKLKAFTSFADGARGL